jgi:polar amino acid transport system substrate-binding protein
MSLADRDEGLAEIARQGTVRVAINTGNAATVSVAPDGTLGGASVTLAHELSDALGLPVTLLRFATAREIVLAEQEEDAWDVAFLAIDPERAERLYFSQPYLSIGAGYAVHAKSSFSRPEDLDRTGVRIASSGGAAYDLFLQRHLRSATLVQHNSPATAIAAFTSGGFDAVAGLRVGLASAFADNAAVRILPKSFLVIDHAIAVPRRKRHAATLIDAFIRDRSAVENKLVVPHG